MKTQTWSNPQEALSKVCMNFEGKGILKADGFSQTFSLDSYFFEDENRWTLLTSIPFKGELDLTMIYTKDREYITGRLLAELNKSGRADVTNLLKEMSVRFSKFLRLVKNSKNYSLEKINDLGKGIMFEGRLLEQKQFDDGIELDDVRDSSSMKFKAHSYNGSYFESLELSLSVLQDLKLIDTSLHFKLNSCPKQAATGVK